MRNLPHQLVEAFRSTLEEVGDSDVIVHVVDGAHPDPAAQLATVRDVIGEVGARDLPEIVAFNKSDLVDDDRRLVLRGLEPTALFVSARTGEGIDELLERIAELLPQPERRGRAARAVRPRRPGVVRARQRARVLSTDYEEGGTRMRLLADERVAERLRSAVAPQPS